MICVSIGRTRHKMILVEIAEAAKRGAELIELRLDFVARPPDFKRLLADKPCPMIAVARRVEDGGRWSRDETERQMLLRQAIVAGFDWVDLETDIADQIPRFKDVKRIVSYHNLREIPEDFEDIYARMCQQDPDVVKIVVRAQNPLDNLFILQFLQKCQRPTVAHCMGDLGVASRVLSGKFGSAFAYAAFNKERGIAPGILSFDDMKNLYRYDAINADTKVFAVIGDPVGHSLSPLLHNAAFHALGLNCVYVPFRIPRPDLMDCLREFQKIPIEGYSVTIPHKESAATYARTRDADVERTKAANTLLRNEDSFAAYNTDCQAAIDALRGFMATFDESPRLDGKTVLLLGAGGVSRAIAHGLHREGSLVIIANRTGSRAQKLAEEVGCRITDWAARHTVNCDILINGTSVGMHPNVDESPVHHGMLRENMVVFDTVYTPETTLLVKEARARACHVLTGVEMFVRQAALQFKLFTGQEPPLELMRKIVKKALSPIAIRDEEEAA
jgi:3-dehydroquinate dehydratase/shikimate dehydrogenase